MKHKISDFQLEQFLLRELPPRQMSAIQAQLQQDAALRQRLTVLEQSNQAILAQYPAATMAKAFERKSAEIHAASQIMSRPRWRLQPIAVWAGAMVLAGVLLLPAVRENGWFQSGVEITRMKGSAAQLFIYRKSGDQVEQLRNGSAAKPGDLLQIAFISRQAPFGLIISIDGKGQVTRHFPTEPQQPGILPLNAKTALPAAYELDNAPRFERFFFITSAEEINLPQVMAAARQLAQQPEKVRHAALPLARGMKQISILVNKGE